MLAALIGNGKPHVVLATTHDSELVDLLSDSYAVCHFENKLDSEGLTFPYHLALGPTGSRNAIGPEIERRTGSFVRQALRLAAELDRHRRNANYSS